MEWVLVLAACVFAAIYGLTVADSHWGRLQGLAQLRTQAATGDETPVLPEHSSWSSSRWRAFLATRDQAAGAPWGVLAVPKIGLEVPIFGDTSVLHLNRGAGLIEGTAHPGQAGNVGIAGHRDGFFRALREIRVGQEINVRTPRVHYTYRVASVAIVDAADARLLQTTTAPVITLVTCYPFYFIGSAPQRFVVRGVLISSTDTGRSL
jgi:sortase A